MLEINQYFFSSEQKWGATRGKEKKIFGLGWTHDVYLSTNYHHVYPRYTHIWPYSSVSKVKVVDSQQSKSL